MTTDQLRQLVFSFFSEKIVTTEERDARSGFLDDLENPSELLLALAIIRMNLSSSGRASIHCESQFMTLSDDLRRQVLAFIQWYAGKARAELEHRRRRMSKNHA